MKIYVAMHKKFDLGFKSDLYEPLLVGSYNKKDKEILRDDKGENISSKNENYCELTGVYWIWKNSKENIVGFIGINENYIEGIFIDTNNQCKGIGTSLLNKVKENRDNLTLSVYKKNINAINFYKKNDFIITSENIDKDTAEIEYTMTWNK